MILVLEATPRCQTFSKSCKHLKVQELVHLKSVFKIGCYYTVHPAPPSSLHPAHFNLHPDHLSLHPVLCNTLNVIRTSVLHVSGNFPTFRPKNSKLSILTQNCPIREFGGADSKSGLSFWNSEPKIHFWANLGWKVKVVHWHTGYLEDTDSYCDISFLNFELHFWANLGWKSQSR